MIDCHILTFKVISNMAFGHSTPHVKSLILKQSKSLFSEYTMGAFISLFLVLDQDYLPVPVLSNSTAGPMDQWVHWTTGTVLIS